MIQEKKKKKKDGIALSIGITEMEQKVWDTNWEFTYNSEEKKKQAEKQSQYWAIHFEKRF